MKTKEQIRDLLTNIQALPHFEVLAELTDDHICKELEVSTKKLVQAIIDDDIDGVIAAFTGWDAEGLLFGDSSPLHRFSKDPIPPKEGAPRHTPPADGMWREEDYTWEYCAECDTEQVIYSKGVTACPNCGAPLAPCSCCEDGCNYVTCPYGCTGGDEDYHKAVTNPPISEAEQEWFGKLPQTPAETDSAPSEKENDDSSERVCGAYGTPICDCPYSGTNWAWECPSYAHGVCLEGSPCNGPVSGYEEENTDEEAEDDADSEDFECCHNCSECEINGTCERQEHLSEVDSEVDAL